MKIYSENFRTHQLDGETDKSAIHRLQIALLHQALTSAGLLCESTRDALLQKRTPAGKPYLPDFPDFHYNFSDSGDYLVLAVSLDGSIGVDLQKITPIHGGVMKLAQRFFHPQDVALLQTCHSEEEQQSLFFRIWSVKESYLKCTGEGLPGGLDRFPVDFEHEQIADHGFQELTPPEDGYVLCVCTCPRIEAD